SVHRSISIALAISLSHSQSIHPLFHKFINLFIHPSIHPSIHQSIYVLIHPSDHPSTACLHVCLSHVRLSLCQSAHLSIGPCVSIYAYLCVYACGIRNGREIIIDLMVHGILMSRI
ncbi:uncharacterized protein DC041_0008741, partial [Schistosoma bovis]